MSFVSLPVKPRIVTLTSFYCDAPAFDSVPPERSVPIAYLGAFAKMGASPEAYLCWLVCDDYDAFDVGAALTETGYTGRCIFISPNLPDRNMVLRELAAAFPKLEASSWVEDEPPRFAEALCAALVEAPKARARA